LKETTDQTFNLSSQIANHFGELVQLVDEVIQSHNFSKSTKEQQVRNTTTELNQEKQEKKRTETEILLKEKEIENLKRQKKLDEEEFNKAMDNLNYLQNRESDESQCYWAYNWKTIKHDWWYCPPYKPDPYQIRQVNQTAQAAKIKLEKTIESLYSAEEEETAKKREVDNELKIRIERLNRELHQLNEDVQLLRNTSDLLSRLAKSQETLDKNWKKFVAICGNLQSGATKSFNIVEEANHTSANNWNNELSKSILLTEENLSLIEIVTDIYLKKSKKPITEIV
jgi:predicted RNase H-like nuclease (RuvC/YqgF family)